MIYQRFKKGVQKVLLNKKIKTHFFQKTTCFESPITQKRFIFEQSFISYGKRQKSCTLIVILVISSYLTSPIFNSSSKSTGYFFFEKEEVPGNVFEPGLHCRPLALMTSTSRFPRLSHMLNWMSPNAGDARTCLPTNCPGPRPSMNSLSWPSEPNRADEVSQLKMHIKERLLKILWFNRWIKFMYNLAKKSQYHCKKSFWKN